MSSIRNPQSDAEVEYAGGILKRESHVAALEVDEVIIYLDRRARVSTESVNQLRLLAEAAELMPTGKMYALVLEVNSPDNGAVKYLVMDVSDDDVTLDLLDSNPYVENLDVEESPEDDPLGHEASSSS